MFGDIYVDSANDEAALRQIVKLFKGDNHLYLKQHTKKKTRQKATNDNQ